MSKVSSTGRDPSAFSEPKSEHTISPDLVGELHGVSIQAGELVKRITAAMTKDDRIYHLSDREMLIPLTASTCIFHLLQLQEAVARAMKV